VSKVKERSKRKLPESSKNEVKKLLRGECEEKYRTERNTKRIPYDQIRKIRSLRSRREVP